jgi:hypothetical protein
MDLRILGALLVYYFLLIGIAIFFPSPLGITTNIDLTNTTLTDADIDKGGFFNTGVDFGRFLSFVGFGVGLPDDTPQIISNLWITFQSMITIFTIGFLLSSIWN